jgi:hypothetical protein
MAVMSPICGMSHTPQQVCATRLHSEEVLQSVKSGGPPVVVLVGPLPLIDADTDVGSPAPAPTLVDPPPPALPLSTVTSLPHAAPNCAMAHMLKIAPPRRAHLVLFVISCPSILASVIVSQNRPDHQPHDARSVPTFPYLRSLYGSRRRHPMKSPDEVVIWGSTPRAILVGCAAGL